MRDQRAQGRISREDLGLAIYIILGEYGGYSEIEPSVRYYAQWDIYGSIRANYQHTTDRFIKSKFQNNPLYENTVSDNMKS